MAGMDDHWRHLGQHGSRVFLSGWAVILEVSILSHPVFTRWMLELQESHPHSTYEKEESRKNKMVPTFKLSQLPSRFPEDPANNYYLCYPPLSPKEALQGNSLLGHCAAPQYAGVCGIRITLWLPIKLKHGAFKGCGNALQSLPHLTHRALNAYIIEEAVKLVKYLSG